MAEKKRRLELAVVNTRGFIRTWGSKGSHDGQFLAPLGVAVGCDGTIYVADSDNNRIQCFDCNGIFLRKWGKLGDRDGEFTFPTGLALSEWKGMNESIMSAMMMVPSLASFPPGVLPICVAYIGIQCICVAEHNNHAMLMDGHALEKENMCITLGALGQKCGSLLYTKASAEQ